MNRNESSSPPLSDTLRRAAAVYSRHRAISLMLRALVWLVVVVPVLMLADVLFHFSGNLRCAGSLGVMLAFVAVLVGALAIACFVRPPLLRMARLLEMRNPALGSKLVNILQLESATDREGDSPLTRELSRRAVLDASRALNHLALSPMAREPRLPRRMVSAAAACSALALLTLVGGSVVRQQWLRFLDPFGDHPAFSFTRLEIRKPAAAEKILYGGSVTVEVRASGHQPRELFFTARPAGGNSPPLTRPMSARGDGSFVARLENIRSRMELHAHTGDGASRSHLRFFDVILTPQIGPAMVEITPPAYTGQKVREVPYRFAALQLLAGSHVAFRVSSNRPLGAGAVAFEKDDAVTVHPLKPTVDGPQDVAQADFTAENSGRMTFTVVDEAGNSAAEKPTASLTVTRDLPPAIAIAVPESDALVVEGFIIAIAVDATDDFGLRTVRLQMGINGEFLPTEVAAFEQANMSRHRLEYRLDLAKAGAKPGDEVSLFAEAIDTRPEPQITKTSIRRLRVISEDQYNQQLREQADVALIAGKYEALLDRFEEELKEQRRIEEKLASLREKPPGDAETLAEFSGAFAAQHQLNQKLEVMAEDMAAFGRDEPVYDFEKELNQKLREQAAAIRESVKQNREKGEQALDKGSPPPATPSASMIEEMETAAREQRERLQGGADRANEEIRQPLQEMAGLHELMKDFNLFGQFTAEQRELAEQTQAYQSKPVLNAEDRLAFREMGACQRELAPKLDQLAEKLRHDAKAAEEKFPEAAASARELAGQIASADMPGLARRAAQSMLDAQAADAQARAENLYQEMDRLFCDACAEGQQGVAQGLDRALKLLRGMKPGDSLRQMMLSKNFRQLPGQQGQSGGGQAGMMAFSAMNGAPQLLGGESLMDGPIADSLAGKGDAGGAGIPGAPTAKLDPTDPAKVEQSSSRRTGTPDSSTLLLEYENIADAYFRRLTTKP